MEYIEQLCSYGFARCYSVPAWAPVGTYAEWYWNDMNVAGSPTQRMMHVCVRSAAQ